MIQLDCPHCGATWQANVKAGSSSPCRKCGKRRKVTTAMLAERAKVSNLPVKNPPSETPEFDSEFDSAPEPRPEPEPEPDNGVRLADVDQALTLLPAAQLAAFIRLMLSAAVARQHLRKARPSGWPGAVAYGQTGLGKTLCGLIACRILGVDPAAAIRRVEHEAERSLWTRRSTSAGGAMVARPADVLSLPFLVLDELDKQKDPKVRDAALNFLQGEACVPAEGGYLDVAPAVLATTNNGQRIRPEHRRRGFLLDVTPLARVVLPRIGQAARDILAPGMLPRLPAAHLHPPASSLRPELISQIEDLLNACLTPLGRAHLQMLSIELLALGRAAITSDQDLTGAAIDTAVDYLTCAATTGEAHPDWATRLRRWQAGDDPAIGTPESQPAAPARPPDRYADNAAAFGVARTLRFQLAYTISGLRAAVQDAPAQWQAEAAGIADLADEMLLPDLLKVRTLPHLEVVALAVQRTMEQAGDLAGRARASTGQAYAAAHAAQAAAELDDERDRRLAGHRAQLQAGQRLAIEGPRPDGLRVLGAYLNQRDQRRGNTAPAASQPPAAAALAHQPYHPHLGTAAVTAGKIAQAAQARQYNALEADVLQEMADQGATAVDMMKAIGIIPA